MFSSISNVCADGCYIVIVITNIRLLEKSLLVICDRVYNLVELQVKFFSQLSCVLISRSIQIADIARYALKVGHVKNIFIFFKRTIMT